MTRPKHTLIRLGTIGAAVVIAGAITATAVAVITDAPIGTPVDVSQTPNADAQFPGLASNTSPGAGGESLVAYTDGSNNGLIWARVIDDTGTPGPAIAVNQSLSVYAWVSAPGVAYSPLTSKYLVTWIDASDSSVVGQMINADGTRSGANFTISTGTYTNSINEVEASWSSAAGAFLVAWQQSRSVQGVVTSNVWTRLVDGNGVPSGTDQQLNIDGTQQVFPATDGVSVAAGAQGWLVAWGDLASAKAVARQVRNDGTRVGNTFTVSHNTQDTIGRAPAVAWSPAYGVGGAWGVAWASQGTGPGISANLVKPGGTVEWGSDRLIQSGSYGGPNLAYSAASNQFLVLYDNTSAPYNAVAQATQGDFSSPATPQPLNLTGSLASFGPVAVATTGGCFQTAWYDYVNGFSDHVWARQFGTAAACTPTRTLAVTRAGDGSGGITSTPTGIDCGATCTASFAKGASVTLTATPAAGSTFTGWGGDCSGTATTCTVTMSAAKATTATFAADAAPGPTPSPDAGTAAETAASPSASPTPSDTLTRPLAVRSDVRLPGGRMGSTFTLRYQETGRFSFYLEDRNGKRIPMLRRSKVGKRVLTKVFWAPVVQDGTAGAQVRLRTITTGRLPAGAVLRVVLRRPDGTLLAQAIPTSGSQR